MHITLSVATSRDHYIDDSTSQRLVLSTPEDWAAVYALRATQDAILVGGETLRRDDPSLGLKCEGREPMRVVVSGRGVISPRAKIFRKGSAPIVIFSNIVRPELEGLAQVVVADVVDMPLIVTELEKRGVRRLMVEGGAQILDMFLASGEVDTLRFAVNPLIEVNDPSAPCFGYTPEGCVAPRIEDLGGMQVSTYQLRGESDPTREDMEMMARAIEVSRRSPERDSCYRVGSVVRCLSGEIFDGYTLETAPTHHAEQAALYKAIEAGADLRGATIYASMEPCSTRSSEKESCSELILKYGLRRVLFSIYEPSHFVECHGAENLRRGGVEVLLMPQFGQEVLSINEHVLGE